MPNEFNFGVQKSCTPEQFKEEIKHLYKKCESEIWGTFYFTSVDYHSFFLKFYDEERLILHTSGELDLRLGKDKESNIVLLDRHTFAISADTDYLVMSPDWSNYRVLDSLEVRKVLQQVSFEVSPLSKIRSGTPGDFTLESTDGEKIMVHTAVLVPLWPFFEAALKSDKDLNTKKTLKLECSQSELKLLVRFLYQDDFNLIGQNDTVTKEDAIALIDVAKRYKVPGLVEDLFVYFFWFCDNEELLSFWKKCLDVKTERLFFASVLKGALTDMTDDQEQLDKMSKEDLIKLLVDISLNFNDNGSKKRKISSDE